MKGEPALPANARVNPEGTVTHLPLEVHRQPDDASCGPTCLHAVYRFFGDEQPLERVITEVEPLETGGTLAVLLALHALHRGYRARIYTYNLQLFDPTWFSMPGVDLAERLRQQAGLKPDRRLRFATRAYVEYLRLGGEMRFEELRPALIREHLERDCPMLTGLSATYLYGCARERGAETSVYDDVGGFPTGHFVVLAGYDADRDEVLVADPLHDNPGFGANVYPVNMQRLMGAIMLGVITYDANLLVLEPPGAAGAP
jgi:hypothetical protein